MWLPSNIVSAVDEIARIYYINGFEAQAWNAVRHENELRMLSGWCWTTKKGNRHRYGFKTITVAYRDAWYELVQETSTPIVRRIRAVS